MATCLTALGSPFSNMAPRYRSARVLPWPCSEVYTLALKHTRISPALLQRRLRIPHPKGEACLARLEHMGVVGPREGLGSREVLIASSRGDAH